MQGIRTRAGLALAAMVFMVGACAEGAGDSTQRGGAGTEGGAGLGGSSTAGVTAGDGAGAGGGAGTVAGAGAGAGAGSGAGTGAGSGAGSTGDTDASVDGGGASLGPVDTCSDPSDASCFTFDPGNVDLDMLDLADAPSTSTLDCGTTTLDTSGSGTFGNWCGTAPKVAVQSQAGGSDIAIVVLQELTIAVGNTLAISGDKPVVLVVTGPVTIAGTLDVSALDDAPGAGGDSMCGSSRGGDGMASTCTDASGGGGGGGFGTAGGEGGRGDNDDGQGGTAGTARGDAQLSPLMGGCGGGNGGAGSSETAAVGGGGGGAVQMVVAGRLIVTGSILAKGGNGGPGTMCGDQAGGGGGGSGGAIVLEGDSIDVNGAMLDASGGSGGEGSSTAGESGAGSSMPASPGEDGGDDGTQGGGGGGGGYGRVVTRAAGACLGCM